MRDEAAGAARAVDLAAQGDARSQLLATVLFALGCGVSQDWEEAKRWLIRAARGGAAPALAQLAMLLPVDHPNHTRLRSLVDSGGDRRGGGGGAPRKPPGQAGEPLSRAFFSTCREALALPHLRALPEVSWSRSDPEMRLYREALTPGECRYLATAAAPFLAPARVNDGGRGDRIDGSRDNRAAPLGLLEGDLVTCSLRARLAAAAKKPASHAEVLSVLHYAPGQTYRPHYDFFDPDLPSHVQDMARGGQRTTTVLAWLNDGYTGGHTRFHRLGLKLRGGVGDVLSFANVHKNGEVNRQTLHEGAPPAEGQKWLASLWVRDRSHSGH